MKIFGAFNTSYETQQLQFNSSNMMLESALNSSHFIFGCFVTLVTFMFSFLFCPICLNEREQISRLRNAFLRQKEKSQQKQITKTGCACCGRETTKKGNTQEKQKRMVTIPESD
jgi:hypothetical protein